METVWIARDKESSFCLYDMKPRLNKELGCFTTYGEFMYLNEKRFPEITFENSPLEVELKLL